MARVFLPKSIKLFLLVPFHCLFTKFPLTVLTPQCSAGSSCYPFILPLPPSPNSIAPPSVYRAMIWSLLHNPSLFPWSVLCPKEAGVANTFFRVVCFIKTHLYTYGKMLNVALILMCRYICFLQFIFPPWAQKTFYYS